MKSKLILGLILYRDGNEKESIVHSSEVLQESTESGDLQLQIESIDLTITALIRLGQYSDAESHCAQLETIVVSSSELSSDEQRSLVTLIRFHRGRIYYYHSERVKAIEYLEQCVDAWASLGNAIELSRTLNLLGLCAYGEGEHAIAQDHFERAVVISRRINFKFLLSNALNNLAMISSQKGELETALEYFKECLAMDIDQGRIFSQSTRLHNIATIYSDMGSYSEAREYCQRGLELLEGSENYQSLALSYYNLANYSLELKDMKSNSEYLKRLQQIAKISKDEQVIMFLEVGNAIRFETIGGVSELSKAKEIFRKYIEAKITHSNLRIYCMLILCRILLSEVKTSQNVEDMNEVRQILNDVDTIVSGQKSFRRQAEVLLLKSKIALIELKPKEAQSLLNEAQAIAQKKGLLKIAKMISHEYDILMEQMSDWMSMLERKTSLQERLQLSAIDRTFGVALRKREVESFTPPEEPVMLLFIRREAGITIYTKKFGLYIDVDGAAFGAFITAFDLFLRETLDSEGMVERVKAGEFTLAMKAVDDLTLCYVFKGHSFYATEKLHKLSAEILQNTDCFNSFMDTSRGLDKEQEIKIEECIQGVFGG